MAYQIPSSQPVAVSEQQGLRDISRPLACRQCRARKVKCDRRISGCVNCERLEHVCSYKPRNGPSIEEASYAGNQDLTEAGTRRRRIRRACETCRSMKIKCNGEKPCARCKSVNRPCHFKESHTVVAPTASRPQRVMDMGHPNSNTAYDNSIPTPGTTCSSGSNATQTFDPTNKEAIRGYLDMYFNSFEHKDWPLLHRATTMFDWQQGSINADLLKIICASGLRSVCVEHRPSLEQDLVLAVRWTREVQDNLLKRFENLKIPDLQALVLIIRLRFTSLASQGISMLLSLAARMVFAKRLNYEVPEVDPVKQEGLRRLMWAVYDLDKIYCGGIEDLTLCPTHRMHIRLPNNDSCFQRGLKSRSSFLKEPAADEETYMDSLAYRMRLLDIRDRILRYTRRVILEKSSPSNTQEEMRSLDSDLRTFRESLPDDLQENNSRLNLVHHTGDLRNYLSLHTILHLCRCDLYRFLIPGIREAISQEAFAQTPPGYVELCQHECLKSAIKLCDLWSQVYSLESRGSVHHPTLAIAIYQCTKIIQRLYHLVPESTICTIESLKSSLTKAVEMVLPSQYTHEWVAPCVLELQRLIPLIGVQGRASTTPPAADDQDPRSQLHRRSKYALGLHDTERSDDTLSPSPERRGTDWSDPVRHIEDAESSVHAPLISSIPLSAPIEHHDMLMFMNPFEIQLNPYFDMDVSSAGSVGFR